MKWYINTIYIQYHAGCLLQCLFSKSHLNGTVCPPLVHYIQTELSSVLLLYCLFSAVECEQLSAPANGYFKAACNHVYDSVCEFDCNTGYNLVGSSTRRCQSDKTWSGTAVQCDSKFSVISSANCRGVLVFIRSFIHSSIHPFIHSSVRLFVRSFVRSFVHYH